MITVNLKSLNDKIEINIKIVWRNPTVNDLFIMPENDNNLFSFLGGYM